MKRIAVLLASALTLNAGAAADAPARSKSPATPSPGAAAPGTGAPAGTPNMAGRIPGYDGPIPGFGGTAPGRQPPRAKVEPDVPLTEPLLVKYIAYLRKMLKVTTQEMKKRGLLPGQAGAAQAGDATQVNAQIDEVAHRASEAVRRQVGLSERELESARAVVADVMAPRMQWRMSGGERSLPQMRKQAERASGPKREEMLRQIQQLEENMARLREAKDARQKYGDPVVDRVLKREPELQRIQEKALSAGLLRLVQ